MGRVLKQAPACSTCVELRSTKKGYIMWRLMRQKEGWEKKAKHQSLLDRLKEKDSSSEHGLIPYEQDD